MSIFRWSLLFAALFLVSCHQSDPPEKVGREGDQVNFAGRAWTVKIYEDRQWGPGPNFFSGNPEDVFVDEQGFLHLRIANRDGRWLSSEVVSNDKFGYGTYIFTIEGETETFADNTILGLFTWDNTTFFEAANSEVDIEISRWGEVDDPYVLQYGVQPIFFGPLNPERLSRPSYELGDLNGVTTHGFTWSEDLITWESYAGDTWRSGKLLGEWAFDRSNPARVKEEGGQSSLPIIIPAPGPQTEARINFWLAPWINPAPTNGMEHEVVIRDFEFVPL